MEEEKKNKQTRRGANGEKAKSLKGGNPRRRKEKKAKKKRKEGEGKESFRLK